MSNTTAEFPAVPHKIGIIGIWALCIARITLTFVSNVSIIFYG